MWVGEKLGEGIPDICQLLSNILSQIYIFPLERCLCMWVGEKQGEGDIGVGPDLCNLIYLVCPLLVYIFVEY